MLVEKVTDGEDGQHKHITKLLNESSRARACKTKPTFWKSILRKQSCICSNNKDKTESQNEQTSKTCRCVTLTSKLVSSKTTDTSHEPTVHANTTNTIQIKAMLTEEAHIMTISLHIEHGTLENRPAPIQVGSEAFSNSAAPLINSKQLPHASPSS